jgi:hypothetical protein
MRIARNAAVCLFATLALTLASVQPAVACPFCSAPSLTLSEQLAQSDAVVLVKWVEGKMSKGQVAGSTTYTIESVLKGPEELLNKGDEIALARYRVGKKGDQFILMGSRGTVIEWGSPLEVTKTSYRYLANAPGPKEPQKQRLAYYLNYLEFPDQLVSNDAFAEFANADYKDITGLADVMPRERIRKWVGSADTSVTRLGFYGLLLGLCGDKEDAALMRNLIIEPSDDFRLGIDGVMSGYLLLAGEAALDEIDRTKLKTKILLDKEGQPLLDKEGNTTPLPFSETYAAMQALRFIQRFAPKVIKQERLKQSMRILLDRPELADLVIADLARWKDWAVQDKLMAMYGADEYDVPSIKRAIIRYMLVSTKDVPDDATSSSEPSHVAAGTKHLATLEKMDPKTVREAKRFFFLQ